MGLTNNQKAILHVAKRDLGLSDEEYRDALEACGGVRSAKDLDYKGFKAAMKHFETCGFESSSGQAGNGGLESPPHMATAKMIKKIYALWWSIPYYYEKGKERAALRGFLKSQFEIDDVKFLSFKKAGQVIEAVKAIVVRKEGQVTGDQ